VLLFAEIKVLCLLTPGGRSLIRRLDFDVPKRSGRRPGESARHALPSLLVAGLVILVLLAELAIGARSEPALTRIPFSMFPHQIAEWNGVDAPVDEQSLRVLKASDYLSLNYIKADGAYVNTWIAYYDAQYSGAAAHSPQVCIPGGGWEIESLERRDLPIYTGSASSVVPINRLVIRQGNERSLVYYWFLEGGEPVADETWAKVRLLKNAVLHNRRDGALIRFVTSIDGTDPAAADKRLTDFIGQFIPVLPQYLP
jgi:EpsI family protein